MKSSRRLFVLATATASLMSAAAFGQEARKSTATHRVAIHVNSSDAAAMNMALNNTRNLYDYYASRGEKLEVRMVAHGPGLHMLREDTSPVQERLSAMKKSFPSLSLAACGNTKSAMEATEGKPIAISSLASVVPSGVVELVALQERGWKYLKP